MHVLLTGNTTFKLANFREGLIRNLLIDGHKVTVVAPSDEYVKKIIALGCDHSPITMDRNGTSVWAELRLLLSFFFLFRRIRPDVVFSYTIKNNIYSGIVCRLLNIPFAPNITGLGPSFNSNGVLNKLVRFLYRFSFKEAKTVFFQNTNDLELFETGKLLQSGIGQVLPGSGVDLKRFQFQAAGDTTDGFKFLLVSRLLWDKGVGHYVDVARVVRLGFPNARFQVLGPLDEHSRSGISKDQLATWVDEAAVEYLGSTSDVLPYLKQAHVIVLPSFYREGTPKSLLEAGAIGRPLITTKMPGCRDVVIDGETGFLVAPKNSLELKEACTKLLQLSEVKRLKMGEASRRHISENYDEDIVIAKYSEIVDQLQSLNRKISFRAPS